MRRIIISLGISLFFIFPTNIIFSQCEFIINTSRQWVCVGDTMTLSVLPELNCDDPLSFEWSTTETTQSIIITGDSDDNTFSVTVTDNNNDQSEMSIDVVVRENPTANITGPHKGCLDGPTVSLDGNPEGGTGFYGHSWTSDDEFDVDVNTGFPTTEVIPVSTGSATITYRVEDTNGCEATDTHEFEFFNNPDINLTGPLSACQGIPVTFNGDPSGGSGNYSHEWEFSNSGIIQIISTNNDEITFEGMTPGATSITYTVTDIEGCSASQTINIFTINGNPTGNIDDDFNCSSGIVTLMGNPSGGTGDYLNHQWSSSNASVATINGGLATATATLIGPGTTTIIYTFEDTKGCIGSDTFALSFNGFPEAEIAGAMVTCMGNPVSLMGSVENGTPGFIYEWSSAHPSILTINSSSLNANVDPQSSGSTTITFQVTDFNGCVNIQTWPFTVFDTPIANAGLDLNICMGASVTLGGNPTAIGGTAPYTYNWQHGSTEESPEVTPQTLGTVNYNVEVTDFNGCAGSDNASVNVFEFPDVNISGSTVSCSGDSAELIANHTNSPGQVIYLWEKLEDSIWDTIPGSTSSKVLDIQSIEKTTDYRVTIQYLDDNDSPIPGCSIVTSEKHKITVVPNPNAVIQSLDSNYCTGGNSVFYNSNPTSSSEHVWSIFGNTQVIESTQIGQMLFVEWSNQPATYIIRVIESIGNDCTDTTEITINVMDSEVQKPAEIFLAPTTDPILIYNDSTVCQYKWGYFDPSANNGSGEVFTALENNNFQSFKPDPYNSEYTYFCQVWNGDCPNLACSTTAIYRHSDQPVPDPEPEKFLLYPNPNLGTFTLEVNKLIPNAKHTIEIYNSMGQLQQLEEVLTQEDKINITIESKDKTAGVYHLLLRFQGEVQRVESFIIHPN